MRGLFASSSSSRRPSTTVPSAPPSSPVAPSRQQQQQQETKHPPPPSKSSPPPAPAPEPAQSHPAFTSASFDQAQDAPQLRKRPSLARRLSRTLMDALSHSFSSSDSAAPNTFVLTLAPKTDMEGLEDVRGLAVYDHHALAVTNDGRLLVLGDNSSGQLDPTRDSPLLAHAPKAVDMGSVQVATVSTSRAFSACTTLDGLVFSWGRVPGSSPQRQPAQARQLTGGIRREKVVQTACSDEALYVLTDKGTVWACTSAAPQAAPELGPLLGLPVARLAAGPNHAIFLTATGQVYGVGSCEFGALGQDPACAQRPVFSQPVSVPVPEPCLDAACGREHSAFVSVSGRVFTCGSDAEGNLGRVLAPDAPHWQALAVPGLDKPASLAVAGAYETLLVFADGSAAMLDGEPIVLGPGRRCLLAAAGGSARAVVVVDNSLAADQLRAFTPRPGPRMSRLDALTLTRLASDAVLSGSLGALTGALAELRVACLNRSFLLPGMEIDQPPLPAGVVGAAHSTNTTASGLDYTHYMSTMQAVWNAFAKADRGWLLIKTDELHNELVDLAPHVHCTEQLRAFLLALINPFLLLLPAPMLVKLVKALSTLPPPHLLQLCEWAKVDLLPSGLIKSSVIKPVLTIVDYAASSCDWTERSGLSEALKVLIALRDCCGSELDVADFYAVQPTLWAHETLKQEYWRFLQAERERSQGKPPPNFLCLFDHPFVLSVTTKLDAMQAEAQYWQGFVMFREQMLNHTPVLEFVVRREALVHDVLECVALAQEQGELHKPLRVVFFGEEGQDFGGVRKEFFELLSGQLFKDCFKATDSHGVLWFDQEFSDEVRLELVGTVIGLALYNSTLLDVHFPLALYSSLLGAPIVEPTLEDLKRVDPTLAHGLAQMVDMPRADFEEAFAGLTFEGLIEGEREVTYEDRETYVRLRAKAVMYDSVRSKMQALVRGFSRVCGNSRGLRMFRPPELELALIGQPKVDMDEIELKAVYEGGFDSSSECVRWFWDVVERELSEEQKAALLGFTTGSTRVPIGGGLIIRVQRAGPDSEQLPTSHTCFNTLLLPDYVSRDKLRHKLLLALENSRGFGLR